MNDSKIPATRFILLLFMAALFFLPGLAMAQEYRLGTAVPAWAVKIEPDMTSPVPEEDIASGLYFLLNEKQISYMPPGREQYFHQAYLIANSSGLENAGTLTIDFDPSYQNLKVNFIRVRRDKKMIDQTTQARISVLQREQNLEFRIYDGAKTFTAILGDLRVGDVVEYGYTISGANPVFGGAAFDVWELQDMAGVRRAYYRVLVPAGKTMATKTFVRSISPRFSKTGSTAEYVWDDSALPALLPDENLPVWWFSFPAVQVSEYHSWGDVSAWALSVYQPLFSPDEAVATLARKLSVGLESPEARVAAFIAFVQNEIRYLGIEVGMNSHKPNPPALVIERRFGDCKDKSLLLTALCRAQGVEAWPVLVNSFMGSHVADFLPGPAAFNHVITLIRLGGRDYWIDGTVTLQGASLGSITQADFERGLLIAAGSTGLSVIPNTTGDQPTIFINEQYDISGGNTKPASLQVTTVYTGGMADNRRRYFAENSRQKLEKDFLAYYSDLFKNIDSAARLEIADDRARNELTVMESYTIKKPWLKDDETGKFNFSLYPQDLNHYLQKPKSIKRSSPYAISHPLSVRAVKKIRLPRSGWDLAAEKYKVENEAISFAMTFSYDRQIAECRYDYRTLRDSVPAGSMQQYAADLEAINKKINSSLYCPDPDRQDTADDESTAAASSAPAASGDYILHTFIILSSPLVFLIIFAIFRTVRRSRRIKSISTPVCYRCGLPSDPSTAGVYKTCPSCNPPRVYCPACFNNHQHY